jgi:hypothetical protein
MAEGNKVNDFIVSLLSVNGETNQISLWLVANLTWAQLK